MWNCQQKPIVCFVASAIVGYAQSPAPSEGASACEFQEVRIIEGVQIPGLNAAKGRSKNAAWATSDNEGLRSRSLRSNGEIGRLPILRYDPAKLGRLNFHWQRVAIDDIQEFARAGRVFGYFIRAVWLGSDARTTRLGTMEILYVYDSTGSGRMDTVVNASRIGFRINIPDWVKE